MRSGRGAGMVAWIAGRCRVPGSLALGFGVLLASSGALAGQTGVAGAPSWSPVGPEARSARGEPVGLRCLLCAGVVPRWEAGAFGGGRNPAALAREVGARHGALTLETGRDEGSYRSPLDPESTTTTGSTALGWLPLGDRGGLAGGATYTEGTGGPGGRRIQLESGNGSPWVVADTSVSGHRSTGARLDAAGGWRLGSLGLGVSLGYEAVEVLSRPSRTPRRSHAAIPAASVGGEWSFAGGAARVGGYGRWSANQATTQIVGQPTAGQVTRLNGYAPPAVITVSQGTGPLFYRRSEAETRAGGVTLAGRWGDWALAAWTEAGQTEEWSWSTRAADPPSDLWETRGWEVGGEARGGLAGGEVALRAYRGAFRGRATMSSLDSLVYLADEAALGGSVEGRWSLAPEERRWVVVALGAELSNRDRGDTIPNTLRTEVETLVTMARVEAGTALRDGVELMGGYEMLRQDARGRLPRVPSLPAAARTIVGAELALAGTALTRHSPWAGVGWTFRPGQSVRAVGAYRSLAARPGSTRLEGTPDGDRSGWSVELGFVLR